MFERDLFVALVALVLGGVMFISALVNYQRAFEMRTPKFLAQRLGLGAARCIIGGVGLIVLFMGVYILVSSPTIRQKLSRFNAPVNTDFDSAFIT